MKTKKQCLELASTHDLTINLVKGWQLMVEVNLPEGYQFDELDDTTGLTMYMDNLTTMPEVWEAVYKDIETLVSMKPWHKAQIEVNA